jgi:hypothetical protein
LPPAPSGPGWRRYSEIVTARGGPGKYTIYLRPDPLTSLRSSLGAAVSAPGLVATGGAIAAPIAGGAIASAAGIGSFAGPIGAGIGALVGIIAGLWSAHNARAQGAKTENQALNSGLQAFDASLKAIFQAANAGQITAAQAAQTCQQVLSTFWQEMSPYTTGPGRADASGGGVKCGSVNPSAPCTGMLSGPPCNKNCTATCCVGCQDLAPTIAQAVSVFSSPTGGTMTACNVSGSSYGATARGSYNLTYTPPAAASVAGVENSLASLTGSGSSGTLLLLAALAGLGIYAFA